MLSVAYCLSKRDNTEVICFIIVNLQNNIILVMPVLIKKKLKKTAKKTVCRSFSCNENRQLVQPERALENRYLVVYLKWYSTANQM